MPTTFQAPATPSRLALYPALLAPLLALLLVGIIDISGGIAPVNGFIYDQSVRHSLWRPEQSPALLLVAASDELTQASPDQWHQALQQLTELGARQIIFTRAPTHADRAFFEQAAQLGNVLFGRPLVSDLYDADTSTLSTWPAPARGLDLPFGVLDFPPRLATIYRQQHAAVSIAGQTYPTLAVAAARQLGIDIETAYRVNFYGGLNWLPSVTTARLFEDGLIPELVRGRTVLIETERSLPVYPLPNPTGQDITLAQFTGFALATLLGDAQIQELPSWLRGIAVIGAILLAFIVFQHLSLGPSIATTVLLFGLCWLAAWFMPPFWHIWPPVTEIILAIALTLLLVFHRKALLQEHTVRQINTQLTDILHERIIPTGFFEADNPWRQITHMVEQFLNVEWSIFLELAPGKYHLQELYSLNCKLDDIAERRRDYRRTPYSTALQENLPLRLERSYLQGADPDQVQYMAPLRCSGELLGYWIFGVAPESTSQTANWLKLIRSFQTQIAELLYHRRYWQQEKQRNSRVLNRFFMTGPVPGSQQRLRQSIDLLSQRLDYMEHMLHSLDNAAMLYDLFGHLVFANRAMSDLLKSQAISSYDSSALDLLCRLLDIDQAQGREILHQAIVWKNPAHFPLRLGSQETLHYLSVTAISPSEEQDQPAHSDMPFQSYGILFELIDASRISEFSNLKEQLTSRLIYRVRNDMESLTLGIDILQQPNVAPARKERALTLLKAKLTDSMDLIRKTQRHLQLDLHTHQVDFYPVESTRALKQALETVAPAIAEKRLKLQQHLPEVDSIVVADADKLPRILSALLRVLIEDSTSEGTLNITGSESSDYLSLTFSNTGFGLPDEQLQYYLTQSQDHDDDSDYAVLQSGIIQLKHWGGQLQAHSQMGKGITFTLTLKVYI